MQFVHITVILQSLISLRTLFIIIIIALLQILSNFHTHGSLDKPNNRNFFDYISVGLILIFILFLKPQ